MLIADTGITERLEGIRVANVNVRCQNVGHLHFIAVRISICLLQYSFVLVARLLTLGRIGKAESLRRKGSESIGIAHRTKFLVVFLALIFDDNISAVRHVHIHLVYLLAYKELVLIFRRYRYFVALEVANEVRERLCACINVEREGVFQTFTFLDDGCARGEGYAVGNDLHRRMLVAHWADVAADIIHVL